jgi:hypothetical protein
VSLVIRASQVRSRPIRWAWLLRLAVGYLTVLTGIEGLGKSLFGAWLLARATRGELDGEWRGEPVVVLVIAAEDGIEDVWKPRLDLAGADLDRVAFLSLSELPPDWNLRDGIADLRGAIEETGAKLVWIDVALDHLPPATGGESVSQPTFVRRALNPLKLLVRELQIVGLYSMHPPKSRSASFRDLVQQSQAFSAIPRVGLLVDYHPDDDPGDPARRRVLLRGKGNLGRDPGALSFRIEGRDYTHDEGGTSEREVVTEVEPCAVTMADLAPERVVGVPRGPTKSDRAAAYLRDALADGERHLAAPIRAELDALGIGSDSVVREARRLAGVRTAKRAGERDGPWEWLLDDALTPSPVARARSLQAQDAFSLEGENRSNGGKVSRSHDPERDNRHDRRRPGGETGRAHARTREGDLVVQALDEYGAQS